jgi:hypothetical protein
MTKSGLIKLSVAGDVIGLIPGLGYIAGIPLMVIHFNYAGKRALMCLLEALPMVGCLPIFTIAACTYPDNDAADPVIVAEVQRRLATPVEVQLALPPDFASMPGEAIEAVGQVIAEADSMPSFDSLDARDQMGWCIARGYQLGRMQQMAN